MHRVIVSVGRYLHPKEATEHDPSTTLEAFFFPFSHIYLWLIPGTVLVLAEHYIPFPCICSAPTRRQ